MAITCPKCQSDNTNTARFCSNCATQLTPAGETPVGQTKTLESLAFVLTPGSVIARKYRIVEHETGPDPLGSIRGCLEGLRKMGRGLA